jgi:hypothetical protein
MKPHGMGDLYAAQTVGVGFHSFPGEGAASCETIMKITKKLATKLHEGTRREEMGRWEKQKEKNKNLCNLRNLWFLFFIRLRARLAS